MTMGIPDRIKRREACIDEILSGLLWCSRDWSAWGYGTMSEDDFIVATQDEDIRRNVRDVLDRIMESNEK